MKKVIISLSLLLFMISGISAQDDSFLDPTRGVVNSRAKAPQRFKAPARRAAGKSEWSYPTSTPSTPFAGGSGTQSDPYQISTAQELANMSFLVNNSSSYRNKCYKLTENIILNRDLLDEERNLVASGEPWIPIGANGVAFTGTFDGDGHSVKGIYIYNISKWQGLFGLVSGATIQNLGCEDGYVYGCCHTSGIIGEARSSTIQGCFNTNVVTAKSSSTGGVVGNAISGTVVTKCYNTGRIHGNGQYCNHGYNGNDIAGVCGSMGSGTTIQYSYNTGSIYCGAYGASGVATVLNHDGPNIYYCHNMGNVSCYNRASADGITALFTGYGFSISPSVKNSYTLLSTAPSKNQYGQEKTETEFLDETVCNLLNSGSIQAFKQGEHYPVLDGIGEANNQTEAILYEGKCGDDSFWKITSKGELVIYGTGDMYNYGADALVAIENFEYPMGGVTLKGPQGIIQGIQRIGMSIILPKVRQMIQDDPLSMGLTPWVNYWADVKKITVESGITSLGQGAFLLMTEAEEATIPATVSQMGSGAFAFCKNLKDLNVSATTPPSVFGSVPLQGSESQYVFCYTANNNPIYAEYPTQGKLHVPNGYETLYQAANGWKLWSATTQPDLEVAADPELNLADNAPLQPEVYQKGRMTYTRSGLSAGQYETFCLPFDINIADNPAIAKAYLPMNVVFYNNVNNSVVMMFEETSGVIKAGYPFVAIVADAEEFKLTSCNRAIITQETAPKSQQFDVYSYTTSLGIMKKVDGIDFRWEGTYSDTTVPGARMYNQKGSISNRSNVPAYSGFISLTSQGVPVNNVNGLGSAGDVNGDGKTDIGDVGSLINLLLNKLR